jgi:hypothetical protein
MDPAPSPVGREGHLVIWDLDPIVTVLNDPGRRACEWLGGELTEQHWSDAVEAIAYLPGRRF